MDRCGFRPAAIAATVVHPTERFGLHSLRHQGTIASKVRWLEGRHARGRARQKLYALPRVRRDMKTRQ